VDVSFIVVKMFYLSKKSLFFKNKSFFELNWLKF
jgi:hypothetical protein